MGRDVSIRNRGIHEQRRPVRGIEAARYPSIIRLRRARRGGEVEIILNGKVYPLTEGQLRNLASDAVQFILFP